MQTIKNSIIRTLSYSDIFDFPLTHDEIIKFYIGKRVEEKVISRNIEELVKTNSIGKKGKYFFLNGRKKLYEIRLGREKESKKKMRIARKVARFLYFIPTIKLVGISGSLSMNNSKKTDDIDIFVITGPGCLWMTRFFLNLYLLIKGKKRSINDSYGMNVICPNMLLELGNLAMPKKRQNIFSAHEIVQLKVLVNKDKAYEKLLAENEWVSKYIPNACIYKAFKYKKEGNTKILRLIDSLFYKAQYSYMKNKITNEEIGVNVARFHPLDKTKFAISLYKMRSEKYIKYLGKSIDFEAKSTTLDTPGY